MKEWTFVVIGGGIAGVTCAESLNFLASEENTLLISATPTIKTATNLVPLSKMLTQFDVEEKGATTLTETCPSVTVIEDVVVGLDTAKHLVYTASGETIGYKKLCICTGASPKLIDNNNPYVVGIRDTDSVLEFQKKVESSKRIMIVGNGGIATELVHEIQNVEVIWVIKDKHISATFIDPGAAQFFQSKLKRERCGQDRKQQGAVKRMKFCITDNRTSKESGAALGPDWHTNVNLQGILDDFKVTVEYSCEIEEVLPGDQDWPVKARLTNGKIYGADLIVSATGVTPNLTLIKKVPEIETVEDGGIKVDWKMETTANDVFAAGDACSACWERAPHWLQMRLWTQARQMGMYAAKAMVGSYKQHSILQDFCFELFTHVTKFFGMKVALLGLFNSQTLGTDYELLLRITDDVEYVKLVLKDGKMQGAVLIGETDLEEMCENLILNQLDLTPFGEELLNPNIDIEDYFD